ncbi:MAG: hypothetical protein D3926_05770 [Desulfobacteraceae bacterium]|nr:MAG: hypothetical protein D3926_05770 [Desulfobacteraceae bacterium]
MPNWIFAGLYFPDEFLKENSNSVKAVLKAIEKAFVFISENEALAREYLPKYTGIKKDICMIAALREYGSPREPMDRINFQRSLMIDYGYIKSDVPIETMIDYRYLSQ